MKYITVKPYKVRGTNFVPLFDSENIEFKVSSFLHRFNLESTRSTSACLCAVKRGSYVGLLGDSKEFFVINPANLAKKKCNLTWMERRNPDFISNVREVFRVEGVSR